MTIKHGDPVIIKGYCGFLESYEMEMSCRADDMCTIVLRDRFDPRIRILMEDIYVEEVQQHLMSGPR